MSFALYEDQVSLPTTTLIEAFVEWMQAYVTAGYKPYFLSFMFKPLPGNITIHLLQMSDEIERLYSIFITHVVRNPTSPSQQLLRPLLIAAPDLLAPKHDKHSLQDATINNGLHYHAILLVLSKSRLTSDVVSHFKHLEHIYLSHRLLRLDIKPINADLPYVIRYMLKSIKRRRFQWEHVLIFPKASHELRRSRHK
jgi:hypothetical protein